MPISNGNLYFESIGYTPGFPADSLFPCNMWAAPDQIPGAGGCPDSQPKFVTGSAGLGDLGCGCGGSCGGVSGLGIFDSGLDLTQWSWPEYGVTVLGLWGLMSIFRTGKRGVLGVQKTIRRRRSATQRRARLLAEAKAAGGGLF